MANNPVIERLALPPVPPGQGAIGQWAVGFSQALSAAFQQHGFGINNFTAGPRLDGLVWIPSGMLTFGTLPPEAYPWTASFGAGNTFVTLNKDTHSNDASHVFTVGGNPVWEVGITTSAENGPSDYNIKRVFGPADGGIFQDVAAFDYNTGAFLIRNKIDQETLLNPQFIQPIANGEMFDWIVGAGWSTAEALPAPLPARLPPAIYGSAKAITATNPTTEVVSLQKLIVDEIGRNAKAVVNIYAAEATGGSFAAVLQWFDTNGNPIGDEVVGNGVPAGEAGWVESVAVGTAPITAKFFRIAIRPVAATGVWYTTAAMLKLTVEPGTSFGLGIGTTPVTPLHVSNARGSARVIATIENFNVSRNAAGESINLPGPGSQSSGLLLRGFNLRWLNGVDFGMQRGGDGFPGGNPPQASDDNWFVQWDQVQGSNDINIEQDGDPFLNPDFVTLRIFANRRGVAINGSNLEATEVFRVESMGVGGFLLPRLTAEQRDAMGGKNAGLTIWNVDAAQTEVWDGAQWAAVGGVGSSGGGTAVLAYGDSLTAGVGGTAWPAQYASLSGITAVNEGVGGETALQIRDRLAVDVRRFTSIVTIWAGRNNLTNPATQLQADTAKQHIADMVAGLGHGNFLVLGVTNQDVAGERLGEADLAIINQLNADLATAYGSKFLDVRRELIDNGLAIAGITPTAQDNTDIANDVIPTSLRSDVLHLNTAGYGVVASLVNTKLGALASGGSFGGSSGADVSVANVWTARQTFQQGVKFEVGSGGFFNPGAVYADAALGVVNAGVTGSTDDWGVYTPGGLSVLHNPTGTRNLIAEGRLRVAGTLTELNTGSGWLLARNVITGGNGFDSVNPAQSAFAPLNIQTTAGGFSVNGNVVADASTALMLAGTQTASGLKTFGAGLKVAGGTFEQAKVYRDASLGLVLGGFAGSTNHMTFTDSAGTGIFNLRSGGAFFAGNIGFFNSAPAAKPTITGSRGGNAALASLLTGLASLGLITNSTTA